jgi:6-pyruvoyltetrahydropterin/6-carboxytetrahydropterin synthase
MSAGFCPGPSESKAKDSRVGFEPEPSGRPAREKDIIQNMFQVSVEETFSSGHALRGYKGKCENVHGHNYRVQITLEGPQLDSIGLLVDFTHLKQVIREIIKRLDHQFINDLEPFTSINPSAENLAKYFYEEVISKVKELPPGARVTDAVIWETDTAFARYRPAAGKG